MTNIFIVNFEDYRKDRKLYCAKFKCEAPKQVYCCSMHSFNQCEQEAFVTRPEHGGAV